MELKLVCRSECIIQFTCILDEPHIQDRHKRQQNMEKVRPNTLSIGMYLLSGRQFGATSNSKWNIARQQVQRISRSRNGTLVHFKRLRSRVPYSLKELQ